MRRQIMKCDKCQLKDDNPMIHYINGACELSPKVGRKKGDEDSGFDYKKVCILEVR